MKGWYDERDEHGRFIHPQGHRGEPPLRVTERGVWVALLVFMLLMGLVGGIDAGTIG